MLQLLLIGFNEQNANVIDMFVGMTYSDIKVSRVSRLPDSVPRQMPALTAIEAESDIFVIDVQSVGFDPNQPDVFEAMLAQKLAKKPLLLINRLAGSTVNPTNNPDADGIHEWLNVPYSRQQMAEKLQLLVDAANAQHYAKTSQNPKTPLADTLLKTSSIPTKSASPPTAEKPSDKPANKPYSFLDHQNIEQGFGLLAQQFSELQQTAFFEFAKRVQLLTQCAVVEVNGHYLYLNPFDKSVVASHLERTLDHFLVGSNLQQALQNFQLIDIEAFNQKSHQLMTEGGKRFNLSQLLWLMGLELVPRNRYEQQHTLPIEISYLPNLNGKKFVPSYVMPVLASCLGRSRTLTELTGLFPMLTNAQCNQLIILAIMSNIAKADTLLNYASHQTKPAITQPAAAATAESVAVNSGVKKAQQTGFLKRLLGRLGVTLS